MQRNMKVDDYKLSITHLKILFAINELNSLDKYPTPKGVNNVLKGEKDEESSSYSSLKSYGTLLSYSGRKMCLCITNLVRRGFLTYIYDEVSDGMYLKLTEKGRVELSTYQKKIPSLRKKSKVIKPEIVEIKK